MAKLHDATTLYVGNLYEYSGYDTARDNVTDRSQVILYDRGTDSRAFREVGPTRCSIPTNEPDHDCLGAAKSSAW